MSFYILFCFKSGVPRIVEANTANFSFTTPIKYHNNILVDGLLFGVDYATGNIEPINLYVVTTNKIFKLKTCVLEELTLNIERAGVFTISVSGTSERLEEVSALPRVPESQNTDPYTIIRCVKVKINNTVLDSIAAISIDIANGIEWTRNTTLHSSLNNEVSFKRNYVLTERRISGSVTEFLLDSGPLPEYSTTSSMTIELASEIGETGKQIGRAHV